MSERISIDRFLASLERCSSDEEFMPAFYDRFLKASEEIPILFKETDFAVQNQMLLRSLQLVAGAVMGETDALRELRTRAETHDRHHLNVQPALYVHWQSALIKTASDFDSNWDEQVELAWQMVLGHVVNIMEKHY